MAVKVDDPRDVQDAYNQRFNDMTSAQDLRDLEKSTDQEYGDDFKKLDAQSDNLGDQARDKETTDGGWANNVTGSSDGSANSPKGWRGAASKAKVLFQKKGATAAILALLGIGGAVPFIGSAALPFSIIGNMDARSMMQGLQQYTEDYVGFNIFTNKSSVSTTANKIQGLRQSEIDQLKANGVELNGPSKNSISGKTTFESVTFQGRTYSAGTEFKSAMRGNPAFRKAMIYTKGSYWKSSKSTLAAGVKKFFRIDTNPNLSGVDEDARAKRLTSQAVDGDTNQSISDTGVDDPENTAKNDASELAGEMNDDIDAKKASIETDGATREMAANSSNANIADTYTREGADLAGDATKSLGGKIWSYANSLSIGDTICTIYNVANTANVLARTVALANIVRFAVSIRAVIERAKAGDDNGQDVQYLMQMLQNKDPTTGQSFDETSYAAMLFTGELSSEPSAVSATGGQAMIALYMSMHAIHEVFGYFNAFSGSISQAGAGRAFLKSVCGVIQNLGVQIVATLGSLILGFFSGGSSLAVQAGATAGAKTGITAGIKTIIEKVSKEAITKTIKEKTKNISEQGIAKSLSRGAWTAFRNTWKGMTIWDKVGVMAAGASTFGMAYIVDTLSGANVAGLTQNGFAAFDALGTGWNQYESSTAIASGGAVASYAQMTAYQRTQDEYSASYIADRQYEAKDTPFDLTTPYSSLGSVVYSIQKTLGVSASLSMPSTLMSVMSLPFKVPGMATASAAEAVTPQAIGEKVSDPFLQEAQISTTVTGSPNVIFDKNYTFEEILEKLVDNTEPQISYDGNDETTGEPKLTIIPGSDLEKYAQACHSADRTQVDPEFTLDGDTNLYDVKKCMPGGADYDTTKYPLYSDAIRFIGQVAPDASSDLTGGSSNSGNGSNAARGDGDDVPAEFKKIAERCLSETGRACGLEDRNIWFGTLPGQCASFTAWRVAQQWYGSKLNADGSNLGELLASSPMPGGRRLAFGNGNQAATNLIAWGIADPVANYADLQPGDIVSVKAGVSAGHVWAVKSIENGEIIIEDYNLAGGHGRYGTAKASSLYVYQESDVIAMARVHKGGGE